MSRITVLGLGAMGSRMAAKLLKVGHDVTVWNRTAAAAAGLVSAGAKLAQSPREAAAGAEFVIAMVRDNEASREVWLAPESGALEALSSETLAIDSSTLTPEWIRELGSQLSAKSIPFLEAPVVGSTPQAQAGQLTYFIGGDAAVLSRAEPVLASLGSAIHLVGPLGTGALAKLTANTLLGVQVTALAELIGMLKRADADVLRVLQAVATTPTWSGAAQRVSGLMLAGDYAPQFPVALIEKDFGYVARTAGSDLAAPTIAAARAVFRSAMDRGLANENVTAVVKLFS